MSKLVYTNRNSADTGYYTIQFFVHAWDYATGIPELMRSLNVLVDQGKVLYLGISDTPAWVVVKANAYARQHGLRPFSVYQGRYSAQERDLEREIIPMCRDEGMAIQAFGTLGGGLFKSPGTEDTGVRQVPAHLLVGREVSVSKVLDTVAKRHGVHLTAVALSYAMQKVRQSSRTWVAFLYCQSRSCDTYLPTIQKEKSLNNSLIPDPISVPHSRRS